MPLTIATWNINSVRLRIGLVTRFLERVRPDVLCLQEIKCRNDQFPHKAFEAIGYRHRAVNGQKGYHGVATVARRPFVNTATRSFCGKDDARHVAVSLRDGSGELVIHNLYIPAGGDEPDPKVNEKFAHKLSFLDELAGWLTGPETERAAIMTGDFNVAPLENDVWSHKQLLRVVSHTPVETDRLERIRQAGDWTDSTRHFVAESERLYSWWSYRARDWQASNRGRRLDHIWVSRPLVPRLVSSEILSEARGWERPSDHVPVITRLKRV